MKFLFLFLVFCLAVLAQEPGLYLTGNTDSMRFFNKGDVRWLEFSLVNSLDSALESVRIEVNYGEEVRPLKDDTWKGREGISHREYASKYTGDRKIVFDLPFIAPNGRDEFWVAFVALEKGTHDFESWVYLQNEEGEWVDAQTLLAELSAQMAEIDVELEEELIETLEVKAEEVDTEMTIAKAEYPESNLPRKYFVTLVISVIINVILIIVLIALIFYKFVHTKKRGNKRIDPLSADFRNDRDAQEKITIEGEPRTDYRGQHELEHEGHKLEFGSTECNKLVELIIDNEILKKRLDVLEKTTDEN